MPTKPKLNYSSNGTAGSAKDKCMTPPYAIAPLIPMLAHYETVWECAAGKGTLAAAIKPHVNRVITSDVDHNPPFDFLTQDRDRLIAKQEIDMIITNPPFSLKYDFLAACYDAKIPFALLLPVDTLGAQTAQRLFQKYGIHVILMDKRIDYAMPYQGEGGSAQFPSAWFCGDGSTHVTTYSLSFASIEREKGDYVRHLKGKA